MIVPVAVDTVELCTPDDGRVCRPKHVECTKQRNEIHCILLHLLVISKRLFSKIYQQAVPLHKCIAGGGGGLIRPPGAAK